MWGDSPVLTCRCGSRSVGMSRWVDACWFVYCWSSMSAVSINKHWHTVAGTSPWGFRSLESVSKEIYIFLVWTKVSREVALKKYLHTVEYSRLILDDPGTEPFIVASRSRDLHEKFNSESPSPSLFLPLSKALPHPSHTLASLPHAHPATSLRISSFLLGPRCLSMLPSYCCRAGRSWWTADSDNC